MHFYQLKLALATKEPDKLGKSLFDAIPSTLPAPANLQEYCEKQQQHKSPPAPPKARPSSRKFIATQSHRPNIPPTPLHSPKHNPGKDLHERSDFRFGSIAIQDVSLAQPEADPISLAKGAVGILHLYRELSYNKKGQGLLLCILAVPSYLSPSDFLHFIGKHAKALEQCRIIWDQSPNKYTIVLKFKQESDSADFYRHLNGKQFSPFEPESCHVVYLRSASVEPLPLAAGALPFLSVTLEQDRKDAQHEARLYELPTCPVCLERMDESVTDLLPVLCEHRFDCSCLSKWGESNCPVCKFSQRPVATVERTTKATSSASVARDAVQTKKMTDSIACFICGSVESLWICMVCGHIGCGRYQEAHAYDHFCETNHIYTLEIDTQRIWDYANDGYIHRLIQNTVDGRVMELPSATLTDAFHSRPLSQDKMDAMSIEYTYLLTSQLESQRMFYEDQLSELEVQMSTLSGQAQGLSLDIQNAERDAADLASQKLEMDNELAAIVKECNKGKKKLDALKAKCSDTEREWKEEKEMNASLGQNNRRLKEQLQEKQKTIDELEKQIAKLMSCMMDGEHDGANA